MLNKLIWEARRFYAGRIFPHVRNTRGAARIKITLNWMSKLFLETQEDGDNVFEREWDCLIILDGCRHDLYEEVVGDTEKRISRGSSTTDFIRKYFSEGNYEEVVYVTGNPHFSPEIFKEITGQEVSEVFHEVFHTYRENWNEEENTVMPESIIKNAETAKKLFPEKKLVLHFMQPHFPFIGTDLTNEGVNKELNHEEERPSIWDRLERKDYEKERVWRAYSKNLQYVTNEIEDFVENFEGKVAITADHGNLVGEGGFYGHPTNTDIKKLKEIPYDVKG
jgi:hypothetical protein